MVEHDVEQPRAAYTAIPPGLDPRELLASIVESSDDAIFSKTRAGTITSWNEGARRLYGYTAEEMIGCHIGILIPDDRKGEERQILDKIFAGEKIERYSTKRVTKDGRLLDISLNVSPIRASDGVIVGASVIAHDISERVRLEEFRKAFIAEAAHELRTPLTMLGGLASTLFSHRSKMTDEQIQTATEALKRQGDRAARLVNNLLDLTQLESGSVSVIPQNIMIREAVESALESEPAPPEVDVRVAVRDGLEASADPSRFAQVVTNLLRNAYKYGGSSVLVEGDSNHERAWVAVTDDGPGVPAAAVATLFDPFTRGAGANRIPGSGLGLAVSRKIASAMGGSLEYEGSEDGARFVLYLMPA